MSAEALPEPTAETFAHYTAWRDSHGFGAPDDIHDTLMWCAGAQYMIDRATRQLTQPNSKAPPE